MHVAGGVELAHTGVDQRIAGAPVAPRGEVRLGRLALFPAQAVAVGAVGAGDDVRVVEQHLVVEIAPDQLRQPRLRATAAALDALVSQGDQAPQRQRAEAQVDAQVAGAGLRREVARGFVVVHAGQELVQQLLAAARAGAQARVVLPRRGPG